MQSRVIRLVVGVVLILLGGLWILQGFDLLGQNGGMNGKGIWAFVGIIVAAAGVYSIYTWLLTQRRL
jgi:hypothetical protein